MVSSEWAGAGDGAILDRESAACRLDAQLHRRTRDRTGRDVDVYHAVFQFERAYECAIFIRKVVHRPPGANRWASSCESSTTTAPSTRRMPVREAASAAA